MEIKCIRLVDMTDGYCEPNVRVRYMLEGEIANIEDPRKKIVRSQDVIKASPHRTKVNCPIFYECGGCDFLHINYQEQLKMKQAFVQNVFKKEKLNIIVPPIAMSDKPLYYRHKVVLSATTNKQKLRLGLYRENTKEVLPFLQCHIQDKEINNLLKTIEELLNQYKISAYHIDKEIGIIKHVMIRKSYANQKMLVIFVTNENLFPNAKTIVQKMIAKHPFVSSVVQNIHHKKTHLVLQDEERLLYGTGFIEDQIEDLKFRLSARSFYQVNPIQMIKLYQEAIKMADIKKNEIVLDTYSGVGTISLIASKYAKKVIAVETNKMAHLDAVHNKYINQVDNIVFVNDDVENYMLSINEKIDCLIMDPTRDGASIKFLDTVMKIKPKRIIYVSCDPKTQARDIKILEKTYYFTKVQPVDMFSQTVHVESVALLTLKNS